MVKRAKNYFNKDVTEKLGAILKNKRIEMSYSLGDMEEMTQFPKSTILNIEKGVSTNINYYVAYGQAVELSILPIELKLKSILELTPARKNRLFLTIKIKELLNDSRFFEKKRSVSEVLQELKEVYKIEISKALSTNVSRVLLNLIDDGLLTLAEKKGRN